MPAGVYMLSQAADEGDDEKEEENDGKKRKKKGKNKKKKQWSPQIGWSRNPWKRLFTHNRLYGHRTSVKATQSGAPNWQFEIVITGMKRGFGKFKTDWRAKSRKLERRIVFAVLYAAALNDPHIKVWARDPMYVARLLEEHSALSPLS